MCHSINLFLLFVFHPGGSLLSQSPTSLYILSTVSGSAFCLSLPLKSLEITFIHPHVCVFVCVFIDINWSFQRHSLSRMLACTLAPYTCTHKERVTEVSINLPSPWTGGFFKSMDHNQASFFNELRGQLYFLSFFVFVVHSFLIQII